jgi:undecaprenyl-diphosphatase
MDWLQVVILALVQGITEFLPVSSSAHLILVPVLTNWQDQGLAFDVALHLGSLLAVVLYFRTELIDMTGSWFRSLKTRKPDADARLAWAVLLGTIPVGLAGLAFKDTIETVLRSPLYMSAGLIVFGVALAWADLRHRGDRTEYQMNWKDVLVIGCAQALALFPGTSRSGITITAALFLGMNREASSRFSFLLSIPVIVLASSWICTRLSLRIWSMAGSMCSTRTWSNLGSRSSVSSGLFIWPRLSWLSVLVPGLPDRCLTDVGDIFSAAVQGPCLAPPCSALVRPAPEALAFTYA